MNDQDEDEDGYLPSAKKSVTAFFHEMMLALAWSSKKKPVVHDSLHRSSLANFTGRLSGVRSKLYTASGSNLSVDSLRAAWSTRSGHDLKSIPENDHLRSQSFSGVGASNREVSRNLGRMSAPNFESVAHSSSTTSSTFSMQ